MLKGLLKIAAVALILVLVVSALNISNQAINSLTMENRGPILAFNLDESDLSICFLGQTHLYSKDKLVKVINETSHYSSLIYNKVTNHLYKIWNISQVLFFKKY